MIVGIDAFRRYFEAHADKYVLIGGAACDLLFTKAGLDYRATKDLDIVLCVEVVDAALAQTFADFLDAAGYQKRAVYDEERKFYRFEEPTDAAFPHMIELFARTSAAVDLREGDRYLRLTVEDAVLSLSALLLDADYYPLIESGRQLIEGVSILGPDILIPFKARAFLDLSDRKAKGEQVDSDDIKKHRNDVFRLVQLLPTTGELVLPEAIKADLRRFTEAVKSAPVDPKSFGVPLTKAEGMEILNRFYALSQQEGAEGPEDQDG
ncbi:MAG: hypothetical protein AB7G40_14330 [Hyphomonadaceae bacterium]